MARLWYTRRDLGKHHLTRVSEIIIYGVTVFEGYYALYGMKKSGLSHAKQSKQSTSLKPL